MAQFYSEWPFIGRIAETMDNYPGVIESGTQVKVVIPWVPGMNKDYSDLRFSDYWRTLPYWIQSYTEYVSATVWVKLIETGQPGREFFYYYGNGKATSESSGDAVFLFFDDFPGSEINTSKWTFNKGSLGNGNYSVANSKLYWNKTPFAIYKNHSAIDDGVLEIKYYNSAAQSTYSGLRWMSGSSYNCFVVYRGSSTNLVALLDTAKSYYDEMDAPTEDGHITRIERSGADYLSLHYDDTQYGFSRQNTHDPNVILLGNHEETGSLNCSAFYVDWVFLRKYYTFYNYYAVKEIGPNPLYIAQHRLGRFGISVSIPVSDTLSPKLTETYTLSASRSVTTSLDILLQTFPNLLEKQFQVTDTLLTKILDVPNRIAPIFTADTMTLALSGYTIVGEPVYVTDTLVPVLQRVRTITATIPVSETFPVKLIEWWDNGQPIPKTVYDTLEVLITEAYIRHNALTACEARVRKLHGKVRIVYSDPSLSDAITVDVHTGGTLYATDKNDAADTVKGSLRKWFSLQDNKLDGTFYPMGDTVGWWSVTKSDASGNFSPAVGLTITLGEARTVEELTLYGDDKLPRGDGNFGIFPVDFVIKLYDSDDTLLHTETKTGNTAWNWTHLLDAPIEGVKKLKVEVTKISKANHSCIISEFFSAYTEEYYDDRIINIHLLEEMEFRGGSIPIGNISSNELSVKLDNTDHHFSQGNPLSPIKDLLKKNRKLEAWIGVEVPYGGAIDWYKLGVFWTQDWSIPEGQAYAETTGLDLLERLRNTEFYSSQFYTNYTIKDLAIVVLQDAGLTAEWYVIDDALDGAGYVVPLAWFDRVTHRYALQELAEAALAVVYCDRQGRICMKPWTVPSTERTTIDRSQYMTKDNPLAFSEIVNYVEVVAKPRALDVEQQIFKDDEDFEIAAGATVERFCIFTKSPADDVDQSTVSFTQSGSDIVIDNSSEYYTWAANLVFKNNGATAQSVTQIIIEGKPLIIPGEIRAVAQDADSIRVNGKQSLSSPVENNFIQTKARAQAIADSLLASYKNPRRDVTITTTGWVDLLLGDKIKVVTYKDLYPVDYLLTSQELDYDGGMTSTMKGRLVT